MIYIMSLKKKHIIGNFYIVCVLLINVVKMRCLMMSGKLQVINKNFFLFAFTYKYIYTKIAFTHTTKGMYIGFAFRKK